MSVQTWSRRSVNCKTRSIGRSNSKSDKLETCSTKPSGCTIMIHHCLISWHLKGKVWWPRRMERKPDSSLLHTRSQSESKMATIQSQSREMKSWLALRKTQVIWSWFSNMSWSGDVFSQHWSTSRRTPCSIVMSCRILGRKIIKKS